MTWVHVLSWIGFAVIGAIVVADDLIKEAWRRRRNGLRCPRGPVLDQPRDLDGSRCAGSVPAVSLGTALECGGTTTAASGWRSMTAL
jgi:hypothetical protein